MQRIDMRDVCEVTRIHGSKATIVVFERDTAGQPVIDGHSYARRTITVPLRSLWLR